VSVDPTELDTAVDVDADTSVRQVNAHGSVHVRVANAVTDA
jgi:hypothetical protein